MLASSTRSERLVAAGLFLALVALTVYAVGGGNEHLFGLIGSSVSLLLHVPQAMLVWRVRHQPEALTGFSVITQMLLVTNAAVWMLYAWLTGAFWTGAPGLFNGPLAVFLIWTVLRSRSGSTTRQRRGRE